MNVTLAKPSADQAAQAELKRFRDATRVLFRLAQVEACARHGGLSQFMYGEPDPSVPNDKVRGSELYAKLVGYEPYYHYYEGLLIKDPNTQRLITAYAGDKPVDLIDMGVGPVSSVENKAVPTLAAIANVNGYTGIDNSLPYLLGAHAAVSSVARGLNVGTMHADFADLKRLHFSRKNPLFLVYGNVVANFPYSQEVPNPGAIEFLKGIRDVVAINGGKIIVGQDCNQDEESLMAAYDNPIAAEWMKNILYRMERDLGAVFEPAIHPKKIDYFARWNEANFCMEMGVRFKDSQQIILGDETFNFGPATELHMWNSHKFPAVTFAEMLRKAGIKVEHVLTDGPMYNQGKPHNDGVDRIALHFCKVNRDQGGSNPGYGQSSYGRALSPHM